MGCCFNRNRFNRCGCGNFFNCGFNSCFGPWRGCRGGFWDDCCRGGGFWDDCCRHGGFWDDCCRGGGFGDWFW